MVKYPTRLVLSTFLLASFLITSTHTHAVVINEIRVDQTGADTDEFFELSGIAGESLNSLSYLVIGDQSSNQGYIESVVNLSGYQIASDGFFLVAESGFSLTSSVDLFGTLNFENSDNVTHMLVSNFIGSLGNDIDTNDDGIIDNNLWDSIIDSIALLASSTGGDLVYSNNSIGPVDNTAPAHVYRAVDNTGSWQAGALEAGLTDSPKAPRPAEQIASVSEPSSLFLLLIGLVLVAMMDKRQQLAALSMRK